jgi:hypothetical protein
MAMKFSLVFGLSNKAMADCAMLFATRGHKKTEPFDGPGKVGAAGLPLRGFCVP